MWILIITLAFFSDSVAIHSIEFSSKESCMSAANQYKAPENVRRTLMCVKK